MTVVVTHTTPADSTFSSTGAAAWNADHALSGVGTMAEQNANNVAITGGAINNTVIGGTTPAAGTFTTLTATGQTSLGGDVVITNTPLAFKNASNNEAFRINTSGANYWQVFGATTPVLRTNGGATNAKIGMGGAFPLSFVTNSIGTEAEQLRIAHTASAVNYVQVTGAATGNSPIISLQGSDANVGGAIQTKGPGAFRFYSQGGTAFTQLRIDGANNSVNFLGIAGSVAGNAPILSVATQSSDTNVSLVAQSKGTGNIQFQTNAGAQEQLRVAHTASAVNYVQVTGAATGNRPVISAQGSDTNLGLNIQTKGTGAFFFATGGSGSAQFVVSNTSSSVNYVQVTGATTGNAVVISAQGTDTNIDLTLTPKGTGNVRFGTYTASMALTIQGYIEVKDAGGTIRKLAVIA